MDSDGKSYDPTGGSRYLSAEEKARGLAAIDRLETAWFMDPARVEDLQRLYTLRMNVTIGSGQLGDLGWLRDRLQEADVSQEGVPGCPTCGAPLEWEDCGVCSGDGGQYSHEEGRAWCAVTSRVWASCERCGGNGGWWRCDEEHGGRAT